MIDVMWLLSLTALVFSTVALVRTKLEYRHLAHAERRLAAWATRHGLDMIAAVHEGMAENHARRAWPLKTRPAAEFVIPTGIVRFNRTVTEDEMTAFITQFNAQHRAEGGTE